MLQVRFVVLQHQKKKIAVRQILPINKGFYLKNWQQ